MRTAALDPDECRRWVASPHWAARVRIDDFGCHTWTGGNNGRGHAVGVFEGKSRKPYRVAWVAAHGRDIKPGYVIHHVCNNGMCVNPEHLEERSQQENLAASPDTLPSRMKAKTHCVNGHPLRGPDAEVSTHGRGIRCLVCHRLDQARYDARKRK